MEEALEALLASCEGEREFLRVTSTALKIVQNIQNEPCEEKLRRLRQSAPFCDKPGAAAVLQSLGFELRGNHYVLDETYIPSLTFKKKDILSARRKAGSILGWDVPFSMIKFTTALGACKYGEVFRGLLDEEEAGIKTLKPDCGAVARESFDRELELLPKLDHPNLVRLLAVTLTSDPTSIVLEFIPTPLLEVLNRSELGDRETISTALQVATAMTHLHNQGILHCDLGARNVRITGDGVAKICDFGLARRVGDPSCTLTSEGVESLSLRWTAPEVFQELQLATHSDLWSYGVLLYEMVTFGSVPYASFSNQQVRSKVMEGYRLLQPHHCPDEMYSLMLHCWLPRATERPSFDEVVRKHLELMRVKVQEGQLVRQSSSTSDDVAEGKSSTLKSPRTPTSSSSGGGGGKLKLKEPSYQHVLGKGGGLLRVFTALLSPFHHRVVVVCGRKATAGEVVQVALGRCGKADLDPKIHRLALVNPHSSEPAACYLDNNDRVLQIKAEAPPTAMFILCLFSPGSAILEIVNTVKQNPAFGMTFDPRTRGYLVTMVPGEGVTMGRRGKGGSAGQRRWCVLDGSSFLCYREEEDEGVKQFESFVDVKSCSVSPLSGKKSSTTVRVGTASGEQFIFSAPDKRDMLRWIEALESASHLEPSTMLLYSGEGAVVQTGYLDCQEFILDSPTSQNSHTPPPPLKRRLGSTPEFTGSFSAVDYGRHWTVLKSSGLIQCLISGRPETLFSLLDAEKVKVHNPRKGGEADSFFISLYDKASRIVLQAECPSDHFDWVVAIERVLQDKGVQDKLCGDRGNQSGYVTLKRLMMMQEGGRLGQRGSAMQLYAMPRLLNTLDDVYDLPPAENADPHNLPSPPRQDVFYENQPSSASHASLNSYVNFVPPPPVPPRPEAPPIPPKGISADLPPGSPEGENLSPPENGGDEDYILMNPQSLPLTPSGSTHLTSPPPLSVPGTPIGAHHPGGSPSQPITIPGPRLPGQPSKEQLLRSLSEASATSPLQTLSSPASSLSSGHHSTPAVHSLPRQASASSTLSHPHTPSSSHHHTSSSSLPRRQLVSASGGGSSGYSSPIHSTSPSVGRSQSNRFPPKPVDPAQTHPDSVDQGDDVMVGMARGGVGHVTEGVASAHHQLSSDGYCFSHSPTTDVQKLPRGWRKGYCDTQIFFVNTETGHTTWDISEVMAAGANSQDKLETASSQPGGQWQVVTLEDGQVYYYHEVTRETTWNVQDTFS